MRAQGIIPTNILMAYTLVKGSGRNVADWTPPKGSVDVFAFDGYYGKGKDPSDAGGAHVGCREGGRCEPTGLGETGAPTSDADRVANTREMRKRSSRTARTRSRCTGTRQGPPGTTAG